ncbi:MAG: Fic family protein [Alphaproteobacteria bacterium]|nr:Fic family protein [Alphaproteobacteria bacterium]
MFDVLTDAKAAVMALTSIPYQRSWAEEFQKVQLKHEVAGTSRIEGADFTDRELDAALLDETPAEALSRSQKQARSAVNTYRWIARLPDGRPVDCDLVRDIHRRIVTGCDDDHCPPGQLRTSDQNVIFGAPRHRGVEGGKDCEIAFVELCNAVEREFRTHDLLIQSLAFHYHLGAMHPFLDGNGRTARAVQALLLQRAGLRDEIFIAMSNYYYDEKISYLSVLSESAATDHDLTPFLVFGLKGIAAQCQRLLGEIRNQVSKTIFKDVMYDLFTRLESTKKRVIAGRQIEILKILLAVESMDLTELHKATIQFYKVKNPWKAYIRDLIYLLNLNAIVLQKTEYDKVRVRVRLEWGAEITETAFFERVKKLPRGKSYTLLQ